MLWQRAACLARYSVKWSRRVPCRVNGLAARLRPGAEPLPGLDTGGWRLQFKDHEQGKLVYCVLFPALWALQLEAGVRRPEGPSVPLPHFHGRCYQRPICLDAEAAG